MPARPLVLRSVPVLARTCPRATGAVSTKRYSSEPVKPGDREPGEHGPQLGVVGRGRHLEHGEQGLGGEHVLPGQPAAVVPTVAGRERHAQLGQRLPDALHAAGERRLPDGGQPDLVGEHLRRLVVADGQHPLDDLGDGRALDLGERRGAVGRRGVVPVDRSRGGRPRASSSAKYVAAVSDGSGTRPEPDAGRPSSAQSARMRGTTPSGT